MGEEFMSDYFRLDRIKPGERAVVRELKAEGGMRRRLMDIGLTANTGIECVGTSPMGDPAAYLIRGAVIALRSRDCADIMVEYSRGD